MSNDLYAPPQPMPPPRVGLRVPHTRPVVTYILLGSIIVVHLLGLLVETLLGRQLLFEWGSQYNPLIALGQSWRFLSSMFLHAGLMHLAFNGWALYSLGREVEALFGSVRFTLIYFFAGLTGGALFYLSLSSNPSVGASGAVFGLIGAELAFFLRNRRVFGSLSRQQLTNLLTLVGINLLLGFTIPNINNYAHIGGLVGGFVLGLGLAPNYTVVWEGLIPSPRLVNRNPFVVQIAAIILAVAILLAGIRWGDQRWSLQIPRLQPQAQAQYTPRV